MRDDLMYRIANYSMEMGTWNAFWDELEGKHYLKTPEFSHNIISWIHQFINNKPFTSFILPKLYNNANNGINDRLAIGIRPKDGKKQIRNIAFALYPKKRNKDPLKKGDLLFALYGLRAQDEKEQNPNEESLVRWLSDNKISGKLAKFIYPIERTRYDGNIDLKNSYNNYAQCAIKGFGDGKIMLLNKEIGVAEEVNLMDMESLFIAMIQQKINRRKS